MTFEIGCLNTTNTMVTGLECANEISGGSLAAWFLVALFFITLIAQKEVNIKNALILAGFVTEIVSILFFALGLVPISIIVIPLIVMFGALIAKMITGGS